MSQLLQPNETLPTDSGVSCRVVRHLGGGTQGDVYEAEWGGGMFALKWYRSNQATAEQLKALRELVGSMPPSDRFLWPLEIARTPSRPGYGYLMPLREKRFSGIPDFMRLRVVPTFRTLATAGYQLAEAFLALHARGLCYCDINFGNVFVDHRTGDVAVCDNDNVIVNGERPAILGTIGFMAPELTRREATPSLATDKHSLAVLLFHLLFLDDPLKGKREEAFMCLGEAERTRLYGTEPVYVFDPSDDSNRPVPGIHDSPLRLVQVYPSFLRELFVRAFTRGLRDPHGRVTENEWREAMVRLRDAVYYCPGCGGENLYDAELVRTGGSATCWGPRCRRPLVLPFRIRIGKSVVMLNHDAKLYPHHLDPARKFDFGPPVAEVARHPTDPSAWGLRNLTATNWTATSWNNTRDVGPGRSVALATGTRVNFGATEGEIGY